MSIPTPAFVDREVKKHRFSSPQPIKMFPVTQKHYWALDLHEFRVGDEAYDIATGDKVSDFQVYPRVLHCTEYQTPYSYTRRHIWTRVR